MELSNKNILITGASTGIGKGLVIELAKQNNLIICARSVDKLEKLRDELNNCEVFPLYCDVTDKNSVAEAYKSAIEKFGHIDLAILNSGVGHEITPENYSSEWAEKIINTNFLGVIYWIEQLLPDMMKRKSGYIAGVSSLADNRGFSGSGFYCSSKAALTIYLEGLRIELKKYGIIVSNIRPGFVKTPMTDKNKFHMPFLMDIYKAAKKIKKGIEKEKNIIQFPFPTVFLTRLVGLFPQTIYEFLAGFDKRK